MPPQSISSSIPGSSTTSSSLDTCTEVPTTTQEPDTTCSESESPTVTIDTTCSESTISQSGTIITATGSLSDEASTSTITSLTYPSTSCNESTSFSVAPGTESASGRWL